MFKKLTTFKIWLAPAFPTIAPPSTSTRSNARAVTSPNLFTSDSLASLVDLYIFKFEVSVIGFNYYLNGQELHGFSTRFQ